MTQLNTMLNHCMNAVLSNGGGFSFDGKLSGNAEATIPNFYGRPVTALQHLTGQLVFSTRIRYMRYNNVYALFNRAVMSKPVLYPIKKIIGFSAELMAAIDKWRRKQPDKPKRSEAIRRLVALGLKVKK